jgi:hypothetical protein
MPLIGESAKDVANVIVGVSSTGLPQILRPDIWRSRGLVYWVLGTSRAGTGTAAGSAKPPGIEEGIAASKSPH